MRQHHIHHRSFHHAPVKLPRWQRRGVYAAVAALTLSGLLWLAVHFFSPLTEEDLSQNTAKLWAIRVHAAAALWTLIMLGSLLPLHIRAAWHTRKNRISGACAALAMATLALTGYALGYAPEGATRQWSAWLHWGIGTGLPLLLLVHVLLGHRARR